MRTDNSRSEKLRITAQMIFAVAICPLFWLGIASAQSSANGTFKHFHAPLDYFEAPHELQIKDFLEGSDAERQPNGLILIRDAKLQIFQQDGTRQMTVIAPICFLDPKEHTVNSSGPLQVQKSDDKLLLEGEGFVWRQTNSDLIVSNRVHTTVRGSLTNSLTP